MILIRIGPLKKKMGFAANSTVYDYVEKGLLTRPCKIGLRASAWPDHEADAINAARMADKTKDEIRELVKTLMEKRQQMANEILSAA